MTLEEDLNSICKSKIPYAESVSRIINEQVEIIKKHTNAKIGNDTANNLLNFCKTRAEHGESYPSIQKIAKHYLSFYGYMERTIRIFRHG